MGGRGAAFAEAGDASVARGAAPSGRGSVPVWFGGRWLARSAMAFFCAAIDD